MNNVQYIFDIKIENITSITFANSKSLRNIKGILFYKETEIIGNWDSKEFRYSFDNIKWTAWGTLSQQALIDINFNNYADFFINIKYNRSIKDQASISNLYLYYDSNEITDSTPTPTTSNNAQFLNSKDPSYYLNRDNFFGPYSNLLVDNIDASGVGIYDASSRIDTSIGTSLYFKKLYSSDSIDITDTSSGFIDISIDPSSKLFQYQNNNLTGATVGGITTDSSFFNTSRSFPDIMKKIFFPTLYPSLINPSCSININVNSLEIINKPNDINIESIFYRGSINPSYGTSGYRSGLGRVCYIKGRDIDVSIDSYPSSPQSVYIPNINTTLGITEYKSWWTYDAGEQPLDSYGNSYDSRLSSGDTLKVSTIVEGVYPIFATSSDISMPDTQQPLVSMLYGNNIIINLAPETNGYKQSFDLPYAWLFSPTNRNLLAIQIYNTVFQQWLDSSLESWTISDVTHTIYSQYINYKRYTYNGDNRSNVSIKLIF